LPALKNIKREAFCQGIASGLKAPVAYAKAGYKAKPQNAYRMWKEAKIQERVAELNAKKQLIEFKATERVIERLAMTKEAVGREFALMGFSNMMDFTKLDADGHRVHDLSNVTREQMAAVQELTVDYYAEGSGEDALRVKKVRVKLHPKYSALVGLSRLFGWIVDGRGASDDEVRGIADRLGQMTDEQRLEDAKQLAARIRARLDQDRLRTIEGKATEIED
jgi:phage terminase small subunit